MVEALLQIGWVDYREILALGLRQKADYQQETALGVELLGAVANHLETAAEYLKIAVAHFVFVGEPLEIAGLAPGKIVDQLGTVVAPLENPDLD